MFFVIIIVFGIIVWGIINIDVKLKKQIDNDERIIERLDVLIYTLKEKEDRDLRL